MTRFIKILKRADAHIIKCREILILTAAVILLFRYVLYLGYVPSQSMEDTIPAGSMILASRIIKDIDRGDIVVFEHEGRNLVKRVVGLPGDKLRFERNQIFVNEQRYEDKCVKGSFEYKKSTYLVPADHFFVLGDNRSESVDSRMFGAIGRENILAQNAFMFISLQSFLI